MWPRPLACGALAVAVLLSSSCATRTGRALPTYEDYSDGVSVYTERFLEGWKAGAPPPELFARGFRWSGPLPGEALEPVPSRAPLSLAVFRAQGAPVGAGSTGFPERLAAIRREFASLG